MTPLETLPLTIICEVLTGDFKVMDHVNFLPVQAVPEDVGWFVNPAFSKDINLFGASQVGQSVKKIRVTDMATMGSGSPAVPGDIHKGIIEIQGLSWVVTLTANAILNAYDANLVGMWTRNFQVMLLQIEDLAWDQTGVYCSFSAYEPTRNINVLQIYEFCDPVCGQNCASFPTPLSKNCGSCIVGYTLVASGNCEINCSPGTYPNADYSACLSCPTCCPSCGYVPAATFPYVPNIADLQCQSPLHSDYEFLMGDCSVKSFDVAFSLDAKKTELTLKFDREPVSFDIQTNVAISTNSSWVKGTDYTIELGAQGPDPLTRKLVFGYLKKTYAE